MRKPGPAGSGDRTTLTRTLQQIGERFGVRPLPLLGRT